MVADKHVGQVHLSLLSLQHGAWRLLGSDALAE